MFFSTIEVNTIPDLQHAEPFLQGVESSFPDSCKELLRDSSTSEIWWGKNISSACSVQEGNGSSSLQCSEHTQQARGGHLINS